MKKWRTFLLKVICVALVFSFLFVALVPSASAADAKLNFNSQGKFTILQIADCQDDEKPNSNMIGYIKAALQEIKPDLVVFTGDNIMGGKCDDADKTFEAISAIVKPVENAGIPFTLVFGNHDNEGGVSNLAQLGMYQSFNGCLAYNTEGLTGTANHNLLVYSSANPDKAVYNLWFFDSGNDSDNSYFSNTQDDARIDWYKAKSNELKTQNGGNILPSMAFQHIIFPGVYDYFFKGSLVPTVRIDEYLQLDNACPASVTKGQFDAFTAQGDVRAAVFGHYHMTDSVSNLKGIDIIQTPGASFSAYGHADVRGVRVITIDESAVNEYSTYVWRFAEHERASPMDDMSFWQRIMQFFRDFWDSIKTILKFGA